MFLLEKKKHVFLLICNLCLINASNRVFFGDIKPDTVLVGHEYKSFYTEDIFSCSHKCLESDKCESFNYEIESPQKGLCELNRGVGDGLASNAYQLKRSSFAFVVPLRAVQVAKSCLEHLKMGMVTSGIYRIQGNNGKVYKAYCDMTSEQNSAWTLVLSYSLKNAAQFRQALTEDTPINEENPNWNSYRLSLGRMNEMKKISTHWRITCSFPVYGVDLKDYMRATFLDFDPVAFSGKNMCKRVERIDIKGKRCQDCSVNFSQAHSLSTLHHVKSYCVSDGTLHSSSINNNEYFGNYKQRVDPAFRCSSSEEETTNIWFGGYI